MGTNRYAFYFMPGVYGTDEQPLQIKVGYYTEVAGLGASPERCHDQREDRGPATAASTRTRSSRGCFALNNFWRGLSNLTIKVNGAGQDGCTRVGQLLGRLAGRLPAPGGGHGRQPEPHGLLHRSRRSPAAASWRTRVRA